MALMQISAYATCDMTIQTPIVAYHDDRRPDVGSMEQIALEIGTVARNSNRIDKLIGFRLRDKRTSIGWSQEQLAEKLQIDPKDVNAYEDGAKRVTAERLLRLSEVLGVRPVYFFGPDAEERPLTRDESYLTLLDQGLRLNRAFVGIKNPALREAVVSLVIELARNDSPA
jgi:transcriptional regulator with XRE-family HTH domain